MLMMEIINKKDNEAQDLENKTLIDAIAEMRKNFNVETQNKVLNAAILAEYYVPAMLSKKQQIVADAQNKIEFQEQPQATFLFITNERGETYVPAFTSQEQARKFRSEEKYQLFSMKFPDLAGFTEKVPNVTGFIINPDSEALPFTKNILNAIKEEIAKKNAALKAAEEKAKADAQGAKSE